MRLEADEIIRASRKRCADDFVPCADDDGFPCHSRLDDAPFVFFRSLQRNEDELPHVPSHHDTFFPFNQ